MKNNGKKFEKDFQQSFDERYFIHRLADVGGASLARFTNPSLCDFFVLNRGTGLFSLIELKSTVGRSFSIPSYEDCLEYEQFLKDYKLLSKDLKKENKEVLKNQKTKVNRAMVSWRQIKGLLDVWDESVKDEFTFKENPYIVFSFLTEESTFLVHIKTFEFFWKKSPKKSFNLSDFEKMMEETPSGLKPVVKVEESFIGRSKRKFYDLTKEI